MEMNGLLERDWHRPDRCEKCGQVMEYRGIGEYCCPDCGEIAYDDYGKVRNYLEHHRGASQGEVARATGVSTTAIRALLREDKIEVTENSAVLLFCEICGANIRSGRVCDRCAARRAADSAPKRQTSNNIAGFGKGNIENSGAKRFQR